MATWYPWHLVQYSAMGAGGNGALTFFGLGDRLLLELLLRRRRLLLRSLLGLRLRLRLLRLRRLSRLRLLLRLRRLERLERLRSRLRERERDRDLLRRERDFFFESRLRLLLRLLERFFRDSSFPADFSLFVESFLSSETLSLTDSTVSGSGTIVPLESGRSSTATSAI